LARNIPAGEEDFDMTRLLVRIAAIALGTTALAGCGAFGGGDTAPITPPAQQAAMAPGADLNAALVQAQGLRLKGDLDGSLHILSQLMLAEPDDPRVVGEYGKLMVQQNRPGDAVAFLNRAIQLSPNDWSLYSALGVANDQRSDQANARIAYERALALRPNEPAVLNNYAMSRMLAGDPAAARNLLARAQATGSTDPKILQNVALLDSMSPKPAATPGPATGFPAAPAPAPMHTTGVASNALPPPAPQGAPLPLAPAAHNGRVVMQEVPVDPLAGPVAHHGHPDKAKPHPRLARDGKHHDDRHVASNVPPKPDKPAKPAKPAKDHVPSLRMTADAGKP
jgi:hypothetical protein